MTPEQREAMVDAIRNDRLPCYCGGNLPYEPLRCSACREGILLDRIEELAKGRS